MKSEKLLSAIGEINDTLITEPLTKPLETAKPRRVRWVKYAAVAACLCLLFVLPIAAAQSDLMVEFFTDLTGWRIGTKKYYTDRDFSKEVRSLAREAAGTRKYYPMDTLEEAEEFLGISLPNNPMLTGEIRDKVYVETEVDGEMEHYESHCLLELSFSEDESVLAADAQAAYRYGLMHLYVLYRIPTEAAYSKGGGGIGGINANITGAQTFVTASGREYAIVCTSSGEDIFSCYGYTVVDKILVEVSLIGRSEEEMRQAVTEIMEGYVQ